MRHLDLDQDGTNDLFLSTASRTSVVGASAYAIYLMKGSCSIYVGSLWATGPKHVWTTRQRSHGLLDLHVRTGAQLTYRIEQQYQFNGKRYLLSRYRKLHRYDHKRGKLLLQEKPGPWKKASP